MTKFTKLLKGLLIINFLLIMTNCSTDESNETDISSSSNEAKNWYEIHKKDFNGTITEHIENLQWENAITSEGNGGEVIEVPFSLQNNLSTSNKIATLYNDHHRLMFIKDGKNGFKLYHIQIFSDKQNSKIVDKDFNYYNVQKDFSGKIYIQNLSNGVGSRLEFKNGAKIAPSKTAKSATYDEEAIECVWYGYWYEDGHFEPIELVYCSIGSSPIEYPNPNYGGGGSGGSGGGTGGTSGVAPIKITTEAQFHDLVDATDGTGYNITTVKQTTSVVSTVSMKIMPWISVLYTIKSVKVGSTFSISEVTSTLTGVNVGYSWNQQAFSVTPNTVDKTSYVYVNGTYGAGIEINGVLVGVSEQIQYAIVIDNKNGQVKWGNRL